MHGACASHRSPPSFVIALAIVIVIISNSCCCYCARGEGSSAEHLAQHATNSAESAAAGRHHDAVTAQAHELRPEPLPEAAACDEAFLEKFSNCDAQYNQLLSDPVARKENAGRFARCIVAITTTFIDCSQGDFALLDGLITGIKRNAETGPIPDAQVHYQPISIPQNASKSMRDMLMAANRKKYENALAVARQAVIQKAEANCVSILMAYKKVITNARSSEVLSTIQRSSETTQQHSHVLDELAKPSQGHSERPAPLPRSFAAETQRNRVQLAPLLGALFVIVCGASIFMATMIRALYITPAKNALAQAQQTAKESAKSTFLRQESTLRTSVDSLQSQLHQAAKDADAKDKDLLVLKQQCSETVGANEALQAQLKSLQQELSSSLEERKTQSKHVRELQRAIKKKEKMIVDLSSKLDSEEEISSRLQKECDSLSAQLLLVQHDTSVKALRCRLDHLQKAVQQTQDLLVIAQVKEKIIRVSKQFQDAKAPILERVCVLCMERGVQVALAPCGHVCMCRVCEVGTEACPQCNAAIDHRVYISEDGNSAARGTNASTSLSLSRRQGNKQ